MTQPYYAKLPAPTSSPTPAIRVMGAIDESNANEVAEDLSNDFLALLRAGARTVIPLFH